jgi:hypothetical protein
MLPPDQRLFEADLQSAEFRSGAAKGLWGQAAPELIPDGAVWPKVFLWMAAAPCANAPDRFYVALDATGYRSVPPTGTFWNPATKAMLDLANRPKGRPNSRFAMVFRTDWNAGTAFYHPYDRVAAQSHPGWPTALPHLVWTSSHTIVHYLEEFHSLLNGGDYVGI